MSCNFNLITVAESIDFRSKVGSRDSVLFGSGVEAISRSVERVLCCSLDLSGVLDELGEDIVTIFIILDR